VIERSPAVGASWVTSFGCPSQITEAARVVQPCLMLPSALHVLHHLQPAAVQVEELRARFGPNEVKTKQTPEWKKIARRFADWICILIVRCSSPCVGIGFAYWQEASGSFGHI
jgi:Cation transporter/ATPase, N-terminus